MKQFHMRRLLAALAAACLLFAQAGAVSDGAEAAFQTEARTIAAMESGADPFLDYLEHLAGLDAELLSVYAGDALTGCNRELYDYAAAEAEKLAAGGRDGDDPLSTTFTTTLTMEIKTGETAQEAVNRQVKARTVIDALFSDYPYAFFWHGLGFAVSGNVISSSDGHLRITYSLMIQAEKDFRGTDEFHIREGLADMAAETVKNAKEIVAENAWRSDYGKLAAYRDAICDLVEYNDDAAAAASDDENNSDGIYGNPWQIIWVFDGNPTTNVVCEGYAKAFKFLCDLSSFRDPNFGCLLISGHMVGATGAGSHMWNHVYLGGKTYLVDVTNSDGNSVGAAGGLFLNAPVSGFNTMETSYKFHIERGGYTANITYSPYTETPNTTDMRKLFPQYLTLDESAYQPPEEEPVTVNVIDGKVVVTVTDGRFPGQTVWAAACEPGESGRMVRANTGTLASGGQAVIDLNLTDISNGQVRVFILASGTLCPLFEAVCKSLAE